MSSALIPFASEHLPAHLTGAKVDNADLTAHAGKGFPVISIKGKVFTVQRDGERKILPNPKDPESPATAIQVVIVKANPGVSKNYYPNGFTEGAEKVKPVCWSGDGVAPDRLASQPQSKQCATCKQNEWGSKVSEQGKKVKACQDTVRIAVAQPNQMDDPYLIRVPPASIRPLGDYGKILAKRNVGYNMVLTNISFEPESATPQLVFKPIGFLPEEVFEQAKAAGESDIVKAIIGMRDYAHVAAPADEIPQPGMADIPVPAPEPVVSKSQAKRTEAQKEEPKPASINEADLSLAMDDFKIEL